MPPITLILAVLAGAASAPTAAPPAPPAAPPAPPPARSRPAGAPAPDLIALLLADPDYETRRAEILRALRERAEGPCAPLTPFAGHPSETVREHAVRALDDAGCGRFEAYRPFTGDRSAWVVEALVRAVKRQRAREAVPFLLARLRDPRRVVTADGSGSVAESARRALMAITCQSFHFDPQGTPDSRDESATRWAEWYARHGGEPREAWVASGIALARGYLANGTDPERREAFELLGLIGPPAVPVLRAALERRPEEVRATLACIPEEPPRVTDEIPCVLQVENLSARRVALALGAPEVTVTRRNLDPAGKAPAGKAPAGKAAAGKGSSRGSAARGGSPPEKPAPREEPTVALEDLAGSITDLTPGAILKREFKMGPVGAAGHYDVRAALPDLSSTLREAGASPRAAPPSPIAASTEVHVEQ